MVSMEHAGNVLVTNEKSVFGIFHNFIQPNCRNGHTDRQTDRHTDTQTDTQTEIDFYIYRLEELARLRPGGIRVMLFSVAVKLV